MSILAKSFREQVKKSKDFAMISEAESNVGYSTGFLSFDFRNGAVVYGVNDKGESAPYHSVGITDGSMVMVIGRSGSGKTTWVVQTAANIIKPFKTSCIYHDDIEGGLSHARKLKLTKIPPSEIKQKYIHRNKGITGENFYERLTMIHDIKISNYDDYSYNTGKFNESGEPIIKLEPTPYILDSLALLMPAKYTAEETISGQMSATAAAKLNSMIFKRAIPMCKSANIILLIINHINTAIDIGFAKSTAQVSYLKQNEALPGGKASVYLSNLLIKFSDHSKLKEDSPFGFTGTLVDLILVKSRVNRANQVATLMFNQEEGFDPELSLFIMLKQHKKINGAGRWLYIGDHKDIKFSQRDFKEELKKNKDLQKIFMEECMIILKSYLADDPGMLAMQQGKQDDYDLTRDMLLTIN